MPDVKKYTYVDAGEIQTQINLRSSTSRITILEPGIEELK